METAWSSYLGKRICVRIQSVGTWVICHKCQEKRGKVSPMGSGGIRSLSLWSWVKGWAGREVVQVGKVEGLEGSWEVEEFKSVVCREGGLSRFYPLLSISHSRLTLFSTAEKELLPHLSEATHIFCSSLWWRRQGPPAAMSVDSRQERLRPSEVLCCCGKKREQMTFWAFWRPFLKIRVYVTFSFYGKPLK